MSKLSELKSSPDVGLAEYVAKVCVSAKLTAELEAADRELFEREQVVIDLRSQLEEAAKPDSDRPGPPRRSGQSANADLRRALEEAEAAVEEAAKVSDSVRERMEKHIVLVTLRARQAGDWRRWAQAHPARTEWVRTGGTDEDPDGEERVIERDRRFAAGFCDIDALAEDLHLWIVGYEDESPSDEWWELVSTQGAPAHIRDAASRVVQMQEQVVDTGKSRVAWLAERRSAVTSK